LCVAVGSNGVDVNVDVIVLNILETGVVVAVVGLNGVALTVDVVVLFETGVMGQDDRDCIGACVRACDGQRVRVCVLYSYSVIHCHKS